MPKKRCAHGVPKIMEENERGNDVKDYELYEVRKMLRNVLIWIYEHYPEETIENIFIECFGIDDADYLIRAFCDVRG